MRLLGHECSVWYLSKYIHGVIVAIHSAGGIIFSVKIQAGNDYRWVEPEHVYIDGVCLYPAVTPYPGP